ncbi:MAG TPA: hypothetical protein VL171_14780 [Verrucomicrobiae bacterium]|nr:hypothetical protein [Verrucomicrobiae bacterium]
MPGLENLLARSIENKVESCREIVRQLSNSARLSNGVAIKDIPEAARDAD